MTTLHYQGNCTEAVGAGEILGPDLHGARYRIIGASYDPDTDRTTAQLRPVAPAQLADIVEAAREATWEHVEARMAIAELFGGEVA